VEKKTIIKGMHVYLIGLVPVYLLRNSVKSFLITIRQQVSFNWQSDLLPGLNKEYKPMMIVTYAAFAVLFE